MSVFLLFPLPPFPAASVISFLEHYVTSFLSPHCFSSLFLQHNFTDIACVKLLISKLLGIAILAGSVLVKLPQIIKLLKAGRADSINPSMYIFELVGYAIVTGYNYKKGHDFTAYGENVFLLIQGFVLVFLVFLFNKRINALFFTGAAAYFSFLYSLFFILSLSSLTVLQPFTMVIFAASRVPQIYTNWKEGSTGQLAFITCIMNFAGTSARIFTTIQLLNDRLMLIGTLVSWALNGIILGQVFWYWTETERKLKRETGVGKRKKEEKPEQERETKREETTVAATNAAPVRQRSKRAD